MEYNAYNYTPLVRTLQGYGGKMSIFGMKVEHDSQNFLELKLWKTMKQFLVGKIKAAESSFAKTMPWAPHEYIVGSKYLLADEEFLYFVNLRRNYGKVKRRGRTLILISILMITSIGRWLHQWKKPPVIKGKGHYSIWQYSEKGIVNGISKPVDLNRFHPDFIISDLLLN